MKRKIKGYKVIMLIMTMALSSFSLSGQTAGDWTNQPIPIILGPESSDESFRSPAACPINAFYYELSESVLVSFDYPLGIVSVSITNLDTGYYAQDIINSGFRIVVLNTPTGNGKCVIRFLLADGTMYVGEYVNQS